ncbi:MAG: 2-oxoglutarate dehydrogenase complex dihydrolipoyllysine-residue succinyltransferase [Verrucomicrobia bacterium]|nr:2-oxoglutarate dehydrogenase complex dihydrolipoyllysine-residue succinyltransferase [Verrucomicrobiota bacterium]
MSIEVKVPSVGESVTTGVISVWHRKSGDTVKDGEALFTLETDKIATEVPAPASGRLNIQVEAGQDVKIGQVVASLEAADKSETGAPAASPATAASPLPAALSARPVTEPNAESRPLSPAARRIAAEQKAPIEEISGSGKHGQVTKPDIINFLETRSAPSSISPMLEEPATASPETAAQVTPRTTRKKLTPLRRKIATQLVEAQRNAAMLTTFNECDMSAIMSLRTRYQDTFQKRHGAKLGFMSFFIKSVVDALQAVPAMNARLEGDELVENHFYDIGVAVGTDRGLVVPVIRSADTKSFAQLELDVADYAKKAREGKLQLDHLTGGGFTITNGGIYGSLLSTPILNPPQSGILGMHKIQNRPVAIGDKIEVRPMMYLALSYDHRVVDGKEAVTFLVRVKECVEDPTRLLLQG